MKIVHLIPGSGNTFYCQNCMRDGSLIKALRIRGHDVLAAPMYLPLFVDDPNISRDVPVFYGAVNTYLKQVLPIFRKAPRWMEALLDSDMVLHWAARKAGSTRARGLEEMTISMLSGETGRQATELEHLINWLSADGKPDIVQLSNALLLGLARRLKQALGCKIVCGLQDEYGWINAMDKQQATRIWALMAGRAEDVDAFIAVSDFYAQLVQGQLSIPDNKLHTVHIGVEPGDYSPASLSFTPPRLGFLSRMTNSLGLSVLVEAFMLLKKRPELANLELSICGGAVGDDRALLKNITKRLARQGMAEALTIVEDFEKTSRLDFLRSLTVLSVPTPEGEAFGTYIVEAQASGIPVVQPRIGAFPEIIEKTGGGLLYDKNDAETLADTLAALLQDPERARALGKKGRAGVASYFSMDKMVSKTLHIYESIHAG